MGSSRPVRAPTVPDQSMTISAPVPGTPGTSKFPSTRARPSWTGTSAMRIFPVLVLWMRTRVTPSSTGTSFSSTANGPMAEEMLPQFPPQPMPSVAMWTCPKV